MTPDERFEAKQAAMSDAELAELAEKEVLNLACSHGKSLRMCVPPMTTDTDMLLCELIKRFKKLTDNNPCAKSPIYLEDVDNPVAYLDVD